MTQQPNEQQDALVTLVSRAIYLNRHGRYPEGTAFDSSYDYAQAALAAVREGHVVVPMDLIMRVLDAHQNPMATADTFIARRSSLTELRGCLTPHSEKEPHGRAGG